MSGTGYAPEGEVAQDGRRARSTGRSAELERALTVADRANNAVLHQRMDAGRFKAIRPKARCSWRRARPGWRAEALERRFERVGEVPFSSERKLMSTVHRDADAAGRVLVFTKGAPDVLLTRCTQRTRRRRATAADRCAPAAIHDANDALAGNALAHAWRRVPIGCRRRGGMTTGERLERDLVFAGLIGMIDPPRDEAKDGCRAREGRRHPPDDDHR